jgi:hypothetical protein
VEEGENLSSAFYFSLLTFHFSLVSVISGTMFAPFGLRNGKCRKYVWKTYKPRDFILNSGEKKIC